jgi:hypothetical protein
MDQFIKIFYKTIKMKKMKTLTLLILLSSCAAIERMETSYLILYNKTKALKVSSVNENYVMLESLSNPSRTYDYVDYQRKLNVNDTLILNDSIKSCLKINKIIK